MLSCQSCELCFSILTRKTLHCTSNAFPRQLQLCLLTPSFHYILKKGPLLAPLDVKSRSVVQWTNSFSYWLFIFILSYKKLEWLGMYFFLVSLVLGIIWLPLRFTCNKMLCTETYPLQGRLIPVSILLHTTTDYSMFLSCPKELCEYSFEQSDFVTCQPNHNRSTLFREHF